MISIQQALQIHTIAIKKFGGAEGIRDLGALESALARPFQTFPAHKFKCGGEEFNPQPRIIGDGKCGVYRYCFEMRGRLIISRKNERDFYGVPTKRTLVIIVATLHSAASQD